jgi:hypothetical protein
VTARFAIESWGPDYGSPFERVDLPEGEEPRVDLAIERPPAEWAPVRPARPAARSVLLVDGVRRIDARIWVLTDDGPRMGICASYAAGVVRCDRAAVVTRVAAARGAFAPAALGDVETEMGTYALHPSVSDTAEALTEQLQRAMGALERKVALEAAEADLVVLDGPLSGREDVPGAIGYVKSHRVHYLPREASQVVAEAAPGERSPVFFIESTWSRYSWYLRLPGGAGHPWAGIARCEAARELQPAAVIALADLTAATLPRFASEAFRDARAPQNLYPVAGLEAELRHRLGDAALLERALRVAAAGGRLAG